MPLELTPEGQAKIAHTLGLPPDADIAAISNRIEEVAGAGARVNRAIQSGKILASQSEFWLNAFKNDFRGTMAVLDSLAVPRTVGPRPAAAAPVIDNHTAPPATETPYTAKKTLDQMNTEAYADPALHKAAWSMGVRSGLKPPNPAIASHASAENLGLFDDLNDPQGG